MIRDSSADSSARVRAPLSPGEARDVVGTMPPLRHTGYRPPGVLPHQSLRQRERTAEERNKALHAMNQAFHRQGLPLARRPPASEPGLAQWLASKAELVSDWLVETAWSAIDRLPPAPALPSWPALPGPSLVSAATTPDKMDQGGVVILDCPVPPDTVHREAFDAQRYADAIRKMVGRRHQDQVHVVEVEDCQWPYTAQIATVLADAIGVSGPLYSESEQQSIQKLTAFFVHAGYPVRNFDESINAQNVMGSAKHDLLIMADVVPYGRMPDPARSHLARLLNQPRHILHVMMRADAVLADTQDGSREPLCTNLIMVLHLMKTKNGVSLALVNEDCVFAAHWLRMDGRVERLDSLTAGLQELEFQVIPFGTADLKNRFGASFSNPFKPGELLLNGPITPELAATLKNRGVKVHAPAKKDPLGHSGPPHGPFGIGNMVFVYPPLDQLNLVRSPLGAPDEEERSEL